MHFDITIYFHSDITYHLAICFAPHPCFWRLLLEGWLIHTLKSCHTNKRKYLVTFLKYTLTFHKWQLISEHIVFTLTCCRVLFPCMYNSLSFSTPLSLSHFVFLLYLWFSRARCNLLAAESSGFSCWDSTTGFSPHSSYCSGAQSKAHMSCET